MEEKSNPVYTAPNTFNTTPYIKPLNTTDMVTITRTEYDYLLRDKHDMNALISLRMSDDSYLASRYLDQILKMRGIKDNVC